MLRDSDSLDYPNIAIAAAPLTRPVLLCWATVRTALYQLAFGSALAGVAMMMITVLSRYGGHHIFPWLGGGQGNLGFAGSVFVDIAFVLAALMILLAAALILAGYLTCAGAPRDRGVRGWLFASMVCILFVAVVLLITSFM